ncbi:hypothetical protein GE061_011272 [Apolygus lucorum]|uniref:DUF4780 domain-containing protein n=1 Tax=Apolygus lucorum TaxID=248454 RepID=A0A6A4J8S5_APOLU|nr:hypothetical protein GE061_011272 [Apolygus lucorum]
MIVAGGAHVDPPTTDQRDDPGGNNRASTKSRKNLSGAQKRKLARLRDQERGLPPRPRKKGSRRKGTTDGGGDGAVAPPAPIPGDSWLMAGPSTSGVGMLAGPHALSSAPSVGSKSAKEGTPRKRNRDSHGTPPSATKPPMKKPREAGSGHTQDSSRAYSDALNSTKMAVVHSKHPEERLSDVEANIVYGSIVRAAMDSPAGQGPQFCSGHTSNGVVYITCSNSRSKGWLEERVTELKPWDGASLRTGPAKDLVERQVKVGVWIPTEFLDRSDARKLIPLFEAQNPGLCTREWKLLSTKADPKGLYLVLSIDTDSLGWLKGQQFHAHFHVQRVTFKVVGTPHTDAAGGPDQPAAQ